MTGDFSRRTFKRAKHYSCVELQQGRVLLDADWNEQREIELVAQRTLARDLIGSSGGPLDATGFGVVLADEDSDGVAEELVLRAGRYYVDGVLCELAEDTRVSAQPALPGADPGAALGAGRYAVYLDVWERDVTSIQDPDIKEKALGGPDHALRRQVVAQARLLPLAAVEPDEECTALHDPLALTALIEGGPRGRLAASVDPTPVSVDPCVVPATAGYRGLENQLYRVEIHKGGNDGSVTFKWSRDNGSVITAWDGHPDPGGEPAVIEVADLGPDAERGFQVSNVLVELLDDTHQLAPAPGLLARVDRADAASRTLTLKEPMDEAGDALDLSAIVRGESANFPRVRRWDSGGVRRVDESDENDGSFDWLALESGVRVRFEHGANRTFRSGDYWLIPARTVDGTIDWKPDTLQDPHGHVHRYACLAIVERVVPAAEDEPAHWRFERSCQTRFPTLTELTGLRYAGGDGQQGVLGAELPAPLRVQVLNGGTPAAGEQVRFEIVESGSSDGVLRDSASAGATLTVTTDAGGIASVRWTLASEAAWAIDPALVDQSVRAVLLTDCGDATDQVVVFSCHEAQAREVRYDNTACAHLATLHAAGHETDHVQRALDVLCDNPHLDYVGGDGQEALPGEELLNDLVVRVGNGAFAMESVSVEFSLVDLTDASQADAEVWAGSLLAPAPGSTPTNSWPSGNPRVVRVPTDNQGLAWVRYRLGSTPGLQRPGVIARIVLPSPYDAFAASAAQIRFGARWNQEQVATCGELVIRPDTDVQALFDSIVDRGDARICVHPGEWVFARTVEVRNKGNLVITGAGPGSRFVGEQLDRVLLFSDCDSVSVRDLSLDARAVGSESDRLQGALSFVDCLAVDVERVRVRSNYQGPRRLSGIQVWAATEGREGRVRIQHCEVTVGHGQTGILVIDATTSDLQHNLVVCPQERWSLAAAVGSDPAVAARAGKVILDRIRFVNAELFNSDLFLGDTVVPLSDLHLNEGTLEEAGLAAGPGRITIAFAGMAPGWPGLSGRRIVTFTTDRELTEDGVWSSLLTANPAYRTGAPVVQPEWRFQANLRRLRAALTRAAFGIPDGATIPAGHPRYALDGLARRLQNDNDVSAGGQGIVVAGWRTPPVAGLSDVPQGQPWNTLYVGDPRTPSARVTENTITGFVQGVHIGMSSNARDDLKRRRLRCYRARVADNTIQLRVPSLARERHGVFVGNAQSVQILDNLIELTYPAMHRWADWPALDGVRLWGSYGPMLHVRGNHTVGPSIGVRVQTLNPHIAGYAGSSWLVRDNSYAGNGQAEQLAMS